MNVQEQLEYIKTHDVNYYMYIHAYTLRVAFYKPNGGIATTVINPTFVVINTLVQLNGKFIYVETALPEMLNLMEGMYIGSEFKQLRLLLS